MSTTSETEVVITLKNGDLPHIQFTHKNGMKRSFHTDLEFLINSIHNSFVNIETVEETEKEEVSVISSALPPNVVKYAQKDNGTEFIFVSIPACRQDVKYHDTRFKNVGFPNMIFGYNVAKKEKIIEGGEKTIIRIITNRSLYVYKDRFVRDHTKLYKFPYANVFDGGGMCYYDNANIQDLVQLQTAHNTWFKADMNDHLFNSSRNVDKLSLRELLQINENNDFDHELLAAPVGTLESVVNSMLGFPKVSI